MATVSTPRRHRPAVNESFAASVATERGSFCIPTRALTLDGFRDWATSEDFPQHIRAAFIDREVFIDMSNEEPQTHVGVKTEITRVLATLVRDLKMGKFYADGLLVSNEDASVSNNPDALFFTVESLRSGRVRLIAKKDEEDRYREIEGTPDWVLEVVSDGSVQKDTAKLREAYHRAGITEYWLIDARGEEIHFQILHHRKNGYAAASQRDGWQRSRVFGRSFRLDRQRDALGLWEYTLYRQ